MGIHPRVSLSKNIYKVFLCRIFLKLYEIKKKINICFEKRRKNLSHKFEIFNGNCKHFTRKKKKKIKTMKRRYKREVALKDQK